MSEIDLRVAISSAILYERERLGLATDVELAKQLGVYPKHLSRWKNGHFTKLDKTLAELLLRSIRRETPIIICPENP